MSPIFAFLGTGALEWVIVLVVVLLLFGHRLPSVMRSLGQGIMEFKRGVRDESASQDPTKLPPQ